MKPIRHKEELDLEIPQAKNKNIKLTGKNKQI